MATHVFLDLDGTLTDPKIGITNSIRYSMAKMENPLPENLDLDWTIGHSLWYSFKELGLGANDTDQAISYYRERYTDIGLFENHVYEGIPEALQMLKENNVSMYLMTSKPHNYAKKITSHFNLSKFLTYEFGSELNGKNTDKADLIKEALHHLKLQPEDTTTVGDRKFDIVGEFEPFCLILLSVIAPQLKVRYPPYRATYYSEIFPFAVLVLSRYEVKTALNQ